MTRDEFTDLPEHLRSHARVLHERFLASYETRGMDREEIAEAIRSPTFRPVLEQEAWLSSALGTPPPNHFLRLAPPVLGVQPGMSMALGPGASAPGRDFLWQA